MPHIILDIKQMVLRTRLRCYTLMTHIVHLSNTIFLFF